jgi:GxxExxY protein
MNENEIAKIIVSIAYNIHTRLGPGLLESVYETIMEHELVNKYNLNVRRQFPIPVYWGGVKMDVGFRGDLWVENKVIVEIKSIELMAPVHYKQLLTYLKLTDNRLGLLINFNEELIKTGIKRVINGYIQ